MKENQRIYIRGGKNVEQGKQVIEELEKRGGINRYGLKGIGNICYIRPNGEIDCAYDAEERVAELVKEFYTEVKIDFSCPNFGDYVYFIGPDMRWDIIKNNGDPLYKDLIRSGNCFRTHKEALEVSNKFREIIKNHRDGKEKV